MALPPEGEFFSQWIESKRASAKGEWRMRCPIHGDKNSSASINFKKGVFRCLKPGCVGGTTPARLRRMIERREGAETDEAAMYDPFRANTAPKPLEGLDGTPAVSDGLVKGYHQKLMGMPDKLELLKKRRFLSQQVVEQFEIGWEAKTKRYTMPIRDAAGHVRNIRKYQLDSPPDAQKITNHTQKDWGKVLSYGSPPRLFPLAVLDDEPDSTVFVTEGELDALLLISHGLTAISGTGGSSKWMDEWSDALEGRDVIVLYDNDPEGRAGATKVRRSLKDKAASVVVFCGISDKDHGDVTDYFSDGGTLGSFIKTIEGLDEPDASAEGVEEPKEDPLSSEDYTTIETSVIGTMDSSSNGKPLRMTAHVTGRKNPTYSVPRTGSATCTMDAGPKCNSCPMYETHSGEATFNISSRDVDTLSSFIESPRGMHAEHIRNHLRAAKCNQFHVEIGESHTVQELFVAAPMDSDEDDFTSRRVYTFGDEFTTEANTVVNMEGTTWPSPKNSHNEFYVWNVENAETNIDSFLVTPEFIDRAKQFRPSKSQTPLDKARDIAHHMSQEVTHIFGRERLHMAMDLTWHSVLSFPFQNGQPIQRGWVEFAVVGDTRTGKSETAIKLSRHYGVGHMISCENASVAGLIGGATQIGNNWTLQWGDYTLNDRRLVIMDEVSGMSTEVISAMTNVRSSGEAQITKIESAKTRARVRSVWISNPRPSRFVDEKPINGIDILKGVIHSSEDIARFDLAMSVKEGDVQSSMINRLVDTPDPKYSAADCRELILWAWSRTADQVRWEKGSLEFLMQMADKIGKRYMPFPPLIERASVKEKIARLAVALAVRTFSASSDGETVLVTKQHVKDVILFMDELYSYVNFGYRRKSERIIRNRKIAVKSVPEVRSWLKQHTRVTEFLVDIGGSFRAQDMEEMAHADRDEVQTYLSYLTDKKMITKDRAQIVMEPTLQELLREF